MSTEIRLIYTATKALVLPGNLNVEVTLSFEANRDDPPMPKKDGTTQKSRRGKRKATTVHGSWYQGSISIPYITSEQRLQWREYLESTAEEELHRLVHPDYLGWDSDVSDLIIYRPMNTGSFSRFQMEDAYRASINWAESS